MAGQAEPTVVGVVHPDDAVRHALSERLEGEEGIVLAAVSARAESLGLPPVRAVAVVGGTALDDPGLCELKVPLVVAASGSFAEARAAIALRAAELVAWPQDAAGLVEAVRRAGRAAAGAGAAAGRVVAVAGARGGLGTTTVAAWVARRLGARALVELAGSGTLANFVDDPEPTLPAFLAAGTAEGARRALTQSAFEVPVAFADPSARDLDPVATRSVVRKLRDLGGVSVVDAGCGEGSRLAAFREADFRLVIACNEVAAIRTAVGRRFPGTPWILRRTRRRLGSGRDLERVFGSPAVGVVDDDARVPRAADLGRLAPAPAVVAAVAAAVEGREVLADARAHPWAFWKRFA